MAEEKPTPDPADERKPSQASTPSEALTPQPYTRRPLPDDPLEIDLAV